MKKNKKQYNLDVRDVAPVIEEVIRQLPNGDLRLSASRFPLSHVCLAGFYAPTISEQISSNCSMPSTNKEIAKQFYEEVSMIETIMEEMNIPNRPDLQALDRKAYAMKIWDCYAIPWRYQNETVHLIWSPQDLMGSPITHSYQVSYYLRALAEILEKRHVQAWKHARHMTYWRIFGILTLIILCLAIWVIIEKL